MEESWSIPVLEPSQVGEARRRMMELSRRLRFDETDAGKVGLVVTEAATNLIKHAHGGELLVRPLEADGTRGVELLALDNGPGIADPARSLRDGYSTAGSPGTGLGAISRLASAFDLYSTPGHGTALVAELWPSGKRATNAPAPLSVGGVSVAKNGEEVCGDAWALELRPGCVRILLADGLGHGSGAADASREAVNAFRGSARLAPVDVITLVHDALKKTRGAAVALAEIDLAHELVHYAGVGNIAATIVSEEGHRSLVSHNGTLGHEMRKVQEFIYPWAHTPMLIMHSDGLITHWDLEAYPGLLARHPSLIAGVLYRDFKRGRDDVTVVVAK